MLRLFPTWFLCMLFAVYAQMPVISDDQASGNATPPATGNGAAIASAGGLEHFKIDLSEHLFDPDFANSNMGKVQADQIARKIIAGNKPPLVIGSDFFLQNVNKRYPVKGRQNNTHAIKEGNAVIVSIMVSKAMTEAAETLKASGDSTLDPKILSSVWKANKSDLLNRVVAENQDGESLISESLQDVWSQFLDEWHTAVVNKVNSLPPEGGPTIKQVIVDALNEGASEIVRAMMVALGKDILPNNPGNPTGERGASNNTGSITNRSASGAAPSSNTGHGYPAHERIMNHIYHHHDRQMNRADRVRARR